MPFDPRRTCRKNTGPRDSSLMQSATAANSGARNSSPSVAATRSNVRLRIRDERESRVGLSPTSGIPSSVCTSAPPPKTSKYRGTMSICTSRSRIARMFASTASCESFEKAKITRSTPCSRDALAKALGAAEQQREPLRELVVERGGAVVDEAHEVDAVLAMVQKLERELLADVPRADDDRVLRVAGQVAAERPRERAQRRDQERPRASQKTPSRASTGWTRLVATPKSAKIQTPIVTLRKTPTMSSTVEWSVRSSSRS